MKILYSFFLLFSLTLVSCPYDHYKYYVGTFPEDPVNMGEINSEYDDYNSTLGIFGGQAPFCFSSNRESKGGNFNIVYMQLDVIFDQTDGKLTVGKNTNGNLDINLNDAGLVYASRLINSSANELGPYLISRGQGNSETGYPTYNKYILLYSSDETGNLDIKFTENLTNKRYSNPENIKFLNSKKDDAYPALNADSTLIYFCSDREVDFDIYTAALDVNKELLTTFKDSCNASIAKEQTLSSSYNDKCPFILNSLIVFTSDRPGGYGGFDLYYSLYRNGKWSDPINFGKKINTPFNEYRPIVKTYYEEFTNDFMIFSSDRPGGKGGYDLYFVGINKMTD